jgi:hypothetical protein
MLSVQEDSDFAAIVYKYDENKQMLNSQFGQQSDGILKAH